MGEVTKDCRLEPPKRYHLGSPGYHSPNKGVRKARM